MSRSAVETSRRPDLKARTTFPISDVWIADTITGAFSTVGLEKSQLVQILGMETMREVPNIEDSFGIVVDGRPAMLTGSMREVDRMKTVFEVGKRWRSIHERAASWREQAPSYSDIAQSLEFGIEFTAAVMRELKENPGQGLADAFTVVGKQDRSNLTKAGLPSDEVTGIVAQSVMFTKDVFVYEQYRNPDLSARGKEKAMRYIEESLAGVGEAIFADEKAA